MFVTIIKIGRRVVSMIRVVQYGTGKMSKFTMKYAIENGMQVVGAFDINKDIIGKDIAVVMEGNDTGILIEDIVNVEERLKELKPDVVIVTTMSLLNDVKDILLICAKLGINAITTCEEAFYSWNSNPNLTKEIDELAKKNGCTITGCGYQDYFWGNLIYSLAGTTHKIKKIKGSSSYNVEDYGIALAKGHGAGLSLEEFENQIAVVDNISEEERKELIEKGEFLPSYMWNVAGWLASRFNLTITKQTQKCVPITYDEDLNSSTLDMMIPCGNAIGMSAIINVETLEGIEMEIECIGKVYAPDVVDKNDWTIIGEPDTRVVVEKPYTVKLTCANVINRIPDLLECEAGFVPTSKMGYAKFN